MRGSRSPKGHEPHADAPRDRSRGEIEALLDSPELRRIFDGEPKAPATRFAPSARRSRRDPERHTEPVERSVAGLRPKRRRRARILIGLVPLYLAGLIAIFEVARAPGPLLGMFDDAAPADPASVRMMAASKDVEVPTPAIGAAESAASHPTPADGSTPAGASDVALTSAPNVALAMADAPVPVVPPADDTAPGEKAGGLPDAGDDAGAPALELAPEKTAADRAKYSAPPDWRPDWQIVDAQTAEHAAEGAALTPEALPFVAWNGPYPDPRAMPEPELLDPEAAAATEEALDLSARDRRDIQLRLRLAEFDPRGVDGKFGPDTRAAITGWQQSVSLPATGFFDESSLALLDGQTEAEFRAWQAAERARIQRQEADDAIAASSVPKWQPQPKKIPLDGCPRTDRGEIAFGHSMSCDARGVRENFKRDLNQIRDFLR